MTLGKRILAILKLVPRPSEEQIQTALEGLRENEALTDLLDDRSAKALLAWGESIVKRQAQTSRTEPEFAGRTRQVRHVLRAVNELCATRNALSDADFVAKLLEIIDMASATPKEENNASDSSEDSSE